MLVTSNSSFSYSAFTYSKLSSANSFSLKKSNICHWERVKLKIPHDTFSAYKLKASADHKFEVTQNMKFIFNRIENIFGKGQNTVYQLFSFSHPSNKSFFFSLSILSIVQERFIFTPIRKTWSTLKTFCRQQNL